MVKRFIKRPKALLQLFVRHSNFVVRDEELAEFTVRTQHKIPRTGSVVFKHKGKYYRIRELG